MEKAMLSRRNFLGTATVIASATAISGRVEAANTPEAPIMDKATMQPPLHPTSGPDYNPVVTLNGWTLPWRMNGDWKEFHLVAEQASGTYDRSLARRDPAERHGRRRRAQSAAYQTRQDLRLRIPVHQERHLHVPPAFGRDGPDGDGHDGHDRRASARYAFPPGRPRLRLHHEHLRHRPRHLSAEGQRDDQFQHVDLEQ